MLARTAPMMTPSVLRIKGGKTVFSVIQRGCWKKQLRMTMIRKSVPALGMDRMLGGLC